MNALSTPPRAPPSQGSVAVAIESPSKRGPPKPSAAVTSIKAASAGGSPQWASSWDFLMGLFGMCEELLQAHSQRDIRRVLLTVGKQPDDLKFSPFGGASSKRRPGRANEKRGGASRITAQEQLEMVAKSETHAALVRARQRAADLIDDHFRAHHRGDGAIATPPRESAVQAASLVEAARDSYLQRVASLADVRIAELSDDTLTVALAQLACAAALLRLQYHAARIDAAHHGAAAASKGTTAEVVLASRKSNAAGHLDDDDSLTALVTDHVDQCRHALAVCPASGRSAASTRTKVEVTSSSLEPLGGDESLSVVDVAAIASTVIDATEGCLRGALSFRLYDQLEVLVLPMLGGGSPPPVAQDRRNRAFMAATRVVQLLRYAIVIGLNRNLGDEGAMRPADVLRSRPSTAGGTKMGHRTQRLGNHHDDAGAVAAPGPGLTQRGLSPPSSWHDLQPYGLECVITGILIETAAHCRVACTLAHDLDRLTAATGIADGATANVVDFQSSLVKPIHAAATLAGIAEAETNAMRQLGLGRGGVIAAQVSLTRQAERLARAGWSVAGAVSRWDAAVVRPVLIPATEALLAAATVCAQVRRWKDAQSLTACARAWLNHCRQAITAHHGGESDSWGLSSGGAVADVDRSWRLASHGLLAMEAAVGSKQTATLRWPPASVHQGLEPFLLRCVQRCAAVSKTSRGRSRDQMLLPIPPEAGAQVSRAEIGAPPSSPPSAVKETSPAAKKVAAASTNDRRHSSPSSSSSSRRSSASRRTSSSRSSSASVRARPKDPSVRSRSRSSSSSSDPSTDDEHEEEDRGDDGSAQGQWLAAGLTFLEQPGIDAAAAHCFLSCTQEASRNGDRERAISGASLVVEVLARVCGPFDARTTAAVDSFRSVETSVAAPKISPSWGIFAVLTPVVVTCSAPGVSLQVSVESPSCRAAQKAAGVRHSDWRPYCGPIILDQTGKWRISAVAQREGGVSSRVATVVLSVSRTVVGPPVV